MGRRPSRWFARALPALVGLALSGVGLPAPAADVVAVRSSSNKAYDAALAGFRDGSELSLETVSLPPGGSLTGAAAAEEVQAIVARIRGSSPGLVLLLGPQAVELLSPALGNLPWIGCMASSIEGRPDARGAMVAADPLPRSQLKAFKRVLPGLKKLGVVYHPRATGALIEDAQAAARALGLEILALPVEGRKQVPEALSLAFERTEAVWLVRDPVVLSQELFEQSLLLQAERRKPLFVYAEKLVLGGALAAYTSSYREQGREAARLAREILAGAEPAALGIREARAVLVVNEKTAERLSLSLPAALADAPDVKRVPK